MQYKFTSQSKLRLSLLARANKATKGSKLTIVNELFIKKISNTKKIKGN